MNGLSLSSTANLNLRMKETQQALGSVYLNTECGLQCPEENYMERGSYFQTQGWAEGIQKDSKQGTKKKKLQKKEIPPKVCLHICTDHDNIMPFQCPLRNASWSTH